MNLGHRSSTAKINKVELPNYRQCCLCLYHVQRKALKTRGRETGPMIKT